MQVVRSLKPGVIHTLGRKYTSAFNALLRREVRIYNPIDNDTLNTIFSILLRPSTQEICPDPSPCIVSLKLTCTFFLLFFL